MAKNNPNEQSQDQNRNRGAQEPVDGSETRQGRPDERRDSDQGISNRPDDVDAEDDDSLAQDDDGQPGTGENS